MHVVCLLAQCRAREMVLSREASLAVALCRTCIRERWMGAAPATRRIKRMR